MSINIDGNITGYGSHILEYYANDRLGNKSNINTIRFTRIRVFNIKDYGAVGDGITDDTRAIRNTINAAYNYSKNNNVPVVIYFPQGTYSTEQLVIYSNMYFKGDDIDKTIIRRRVANLQYYSKDYTKYPRQGFPSINDPYGVFAYPRGESSGWMGYVGPFIKNFDYTDGNSNLGFTNLTIDGNGYKFERDTVGQGSSSIHNIALWRCKNVYINNVKSINAGNFHVIFKDCTRNTIDEPIIIGTLIIDGNASGKWGTTEQVINQYGQSVTANHTRIYQDGLHLAGIRHLKADYIWSRCGDDAITVNTELEPTNNTTDVYIAKAEVFSYLANGIRFNADSRYDVENVKIDQVIVHGYEGKEVSGSGIMMQHANASTGPGRVKDVYIKQVIIKSLGLGEGEGAYITIWRGKWADAGSPTNITIDEVRLDLPQTEIDRLKNYNGLFRRFGFRIADLDLGNITINNVTLINHPHKVWDMLIMDTNYVTINNLMIKHIASGNTHLRISNSKNIKLYNINMPKIDTNNDGILDSRQGDHCLSIAGVSQYITATGQAAVNNIVTYDSIAQQYASTNKIDVTKIN